MSKLKIAIDAGHGSNTAGKRTPAIPYEVRRGNIHVKKGEQYREHFANVGVCVELEKELNRCGFEVVKTGWNDTNAANDVDTPLSDRQKAIAKANCDYSISVHFNAHGSGNEFTSAEGVGIYIHTTNINQSDKLAKTVQKHLVNVAKQKDRGVTKSTLAMCNCYALDVKGAILLELAFMTNLKEATELMTSEEYWKKAAIATAKGLCEYVGIKYIEESNVPTQTITRESHANDVKWLQTKLNDKLDGLYAPLIINGIYDNKTRIAVLIYWESLGWNKDGQDDGWRVGAKTINKIK